MVRKCALIVIIGIGLMSLASDSSIAAIHTYNFPLDGLQETPPNASPGYGFGLVNYDDLIVGTNLTWNISYNDLLANVTAAHFHLGAPGVPGGVQLGISGAAPSSGAIIGSGTISAAQATNLLAGNWYVNIHTSVFPAGEIRGQVINEAPEPGAWLLLCTAGLFGALLPWRKLKL